MNARDLIFALRKIDPDVQIMVDWDIKNDETILYYLPDKDDTYNKKLIVKL